MKEQHIKKQTKGTIKLKNDLALNVSQYAFKGGGGRKKYKNELQIIQYEKAYSQTQQYKNTVVLPDKMGGYQKG